MRKYNEINLYNLCDVRGQELYHNAGVVYTPTKKPKLVFGTVVGFAGEVIEHSRNHLNHRVQFSRRRVIVRTHAKRIVYVSDMDRILCVDTLKVISNEETTKP